MSKDYLIHYGVIGMRWGVRRSREVRDFKASAKKSGMDRKSAKYKKALNEARVKAANRLYSINSEKVNKRVVTQNLGKALAKTALMGSYGALSYEKGRAGGGTRLGSAVRGRVKGLINAASLGMPEFRDSITNETLRNLNAKKR